MKFYTAKYDRVFKTIFCNEDNPHLMKELLERLLHLKITELSFLSNELTLESINERSKTVDVLVKTDNKYIHIEINSSNPNYLHQRNFIYFSSIFSKKTKKDTDFDLETEFIHIDFTYGLSKKYPTEGIYYLMNKEGLMYIEKFKIIEYNMDKIMQYWYTLDKENITKYKHLIMLDLDKENLKTLSKGDAFIMNYEKDVTTLNEKETFQSAMTYEEDQLLIMNTEKKISYQEGLIQGQKEGQKEGLQQGLKTAKTDLAKIMLQNNEPVEKIVKYTGLSIEEIKNIKD